MKGTWKRARKKPVEVEYCGPFRDTDIVDTIEGDFEIDEEYINEHGGYVIIRGVDGEQYPCALDIFYDTYETLDSSGRDRDKPEPQEGMTFDAVIEDVLLPRIRQLEEQVEGSDQWVQCPDCGSDDVSILTSSRDRQITFDCKDCGNEGETYG